MPMKRLHIIIIIISCVTTCAVCYQTVDNVHYCEIFFWVCYFSRYFFEYPLKSVLEHEKYLPT